MLFDEGLCRALTGFCSVVEDVSLRVECPVMTVHSRDDGGGVYACWRWCACGALEGMQVDNSILSVFARAKYAASSYQ